MIIRKEKSSKGLEDSRELRFFKLHVIVLSFCISIILFKSIGLLILYFADDKKGIDCVLIWTYCMYKTELETSLSCSGIIHCIVHYSSAILRVFWFVCFQSELAEPGSDNLCFEIIITYFKFSFSWIGSGGLDRWRPFHNLHNASFCLLQARPVVGWPNANPILVHRFPIFTATIPLKYLSLGEHG